MQFETPDGEVSSVFVKGPSRDSDGNYVNGVSVNQLSSLSSDDIYTDAAMYASDQTLCACPVTSVPTLSSGSGWVVTTVGGSYLSGDDLIESCGTAVAASVNDLSLGSIELTSSSFTFDEQGGKDPGAYVLDVSGAVVDESGYTLTYYYGDTLETATQISGVDEVCAWGTYWVVATGTGENTGSCSASFTVTLEQSSWTRISSTDRLASAYSVSAAGYSTFGATTTSVAIVVNPDDYASCAIAACLASIIGCTVYTTTADTLSSYVVSGLASAKTALVLGNTTYIPDNVYTEIVACVTYPTRAFTGSCVNAIDEARVVFEFVNDCLAGDYLEATWKSSFAYSSEAALVVPAEGSASAFSAIAWAAANKMPVFFSTSDGVLDYETYEYLCEFEQVWVADFDEQATAAITATLAGIDCVTYTAESSVYASSAAFANAALDSGNVWSGTLMIASPNDYGVLAASAAAAGNAKYALLVADSTDEGSAVAYDFVQARRYAIVLGYVCATRLEFSATLLESIEQLCAVEDEGDLLFATIQLSNSTLSYTGSVLSPSFNVYTAVNKTLLTLGTDYSVLYYSSETGKTVLAANLKDAGSYTLTISGIYIDHEGNTYEGSRSAEFVIGQATEVTTYTTNYSFVALDEEAYVWPDESAESDKADEGTSSEGTDSEASAGSETSGNSTAFKSDSKAKQTIRATKTTVKVKAKKLKKKARAASFTIKNAKGTLVAKASGKKAKKALKVTVSGKTVKVKVAKGTKKGTYKVKVYAAATSTHTKSNTLTLTIKVK